MPDPAPLDHAPLDHAPLSHATTDELEQALAHALRYDGKKRLRVSGELMAKITASHLVEHLRLAGFVVMKRPPAEGAAALYRPPVRGE